jgi:hypothetical protein
MNVSPHIRLAVALVAEGVLVTPPLEGNHRSKGTMPMTDKKSPIHTPVPWSIHLLNNGMPVITSKEHDIAVIRDNGNGATRMSANADFILRACNHHYQLLEAAQTVIENWEHGDLAAAVRLLAAAVGNAEGL